MGEGKRGQGDKERGEERREKVGIREFRGEGRNGMGVVKRGTLNIG
jgi:hypothetical protein